jgi:dTDP-4-dehydrorhamnose 3,5-epimerase-like enzyme
MSNEIYHEKVVLSHRNHKILLMSNEIYHENVVLSHRNHKILLMSNEIYHENFVLSIYFDQKYTKINEAASRKKI